MSETPPLLPLTRSDDDPRAAELLRKVGEPAPLHAARARRILDGVYQKIGQPPPRRWLPLSIAAGSMALAALLVLVVRRAQPGSAPSTPVVIARQDLPISPSTVVVAPAHWLSLGGVAEARDGAVIVRSGRLLLSAGDSPTRLDLPSQHAHLTVPPHSTVDVRVTRWRVQVSAFTGSAIYESRDFGPRQLTAGHTLVASDQLIERNNETTDEARAMKLLADGGESAPIVEAAKIEEPKVDVAPEPPAAIEVPKIDPSNVDPSKVDASKVEPSKVDPPQPTGPSALALETASFERAVKALRHDHDPSAALSAANSYLADYPRGLMQPDAVVLRIEAQLSLGQDAPALATLDHTALSTLPRADEMAVIRGELRARVGRCHEADADLAPHLSGADELAERSLMARAECRAQQGNDAEARSLLEEYGRRFPGGRFSARAARILKN